MKRLLSTSSILVCLLVPVLAQADLVKLPKRIPHHAHAAAKVAATSATAITNLSETFGMWRSIREINDSGVTVGDTMELWIGSDNSTEMRMSLVSTSVDYPEYDMSMKMQSKGTFKVVGSDLINTTTYCQTSGSLFGNEDCITDDPYDTTALANISVETINGKKALVTKADSPDEEDDTLYYVGASASFLIGPVAASVRRVETPRFSAQGGLRVVATSAALPEGMPVLDVRGRRLAPSRPGSGVFLIRP